MQPVHMFPSVPMPPLLLEVLMTASISGAGRSPFSTTAGSQVAVKIPCEEGKEQVPVGPLLIKAREQTEGSDAKRAAALGRSSESGAENKAGGQCPRMPRGVQHDSAPQPQTCSCSARPPGGVRSRHAGDTTTRSTQSSAWEDCLIQLNCEQTQPQHSQKLLRSLLLSSDADRARSSPWVPLS